MTTVVPSDFVILLQNASQFPKQKKSGTVIAQKFEDIMRRLKAKGKTNFGEISSFTMLTCIKFCAFVKFLLQGGSLAEWLGCWTSSPWVPGLNLTLSTSWICFSVVPSYKSFGCACI